MVRFGSCNSCAKMSFGRRRRFGAFTGGFPHGLLQMQGPYNASSYGRRRRRRFSRRFGAFTGGQSHGLLQMQGPYNASSYGRRRRRFSRRFGAFTGGFPHSLLEMQGPYNASSYGQVRSSKKTRKSKRRSRRRKVKKTKKVSFGNVKGQGYVGATTYTENVSAPYFGKAEPWVNASGWWYPVTGGKVQSPGMLMKN